MHYFRALLIVCCAASVGFGPITSVAQARPTQQSNVNVTVGTNAAGQVQISVSASNTSQTSLSDIKSKLPATSTLLVQEGNGTWLLNAVLRINSSVTLKLSPPEVSYLKIRSQTGPTATVDATKFGALETNAGTLQIEDVKITSWDTTAGKVDEEHKDGRAYVVALGISEMNILRSELAYLGYFGSGGKYGVSWRGESEILANNWTTGDLIDSDLHHNYYGFYTYNAKSMTIRGNKIHNNVSYGLDPHDYSRELLIENNDFYENGNHGCVLSRGVYNSIVRNNRSYNNSYTVDTLDRGAHGFMLDPGSPSSTTPQAPVYGILLENNLAWGNDGYGLRLLDAYSNTIRNNTFAQNEKGISIDGGSRDNIISNNNVLTNTTYGIHVITGSTRNQLIGNTVRASGFAGIMVRTSNNRVLSNTVETNGLSGGVEESRGDGVLLMAESDGNTVLPMSGNTVQGNIIRSNRLDGVEVRGGSATTVTNNTIVDNGDSGVYLASQFETGTRTTFVADNTLARNSSYGLRINSPQTTLNRWRSNSIFDNRGGAILISGGAQGGVLPPTITSFDGTVMIGTTEPNATVELFSDNRRQARYPELTVTANAAGQFTINLSRPLKATQPNLTTTTKAGSSSALLYESETPLPGLWLPLIRR
jgi:parallel beta-helix repeat protein